MNNILLPILIFLPLLMSIIIMMPIFAKDEKIINTIVRGIGILHFVLSIILLIIYNISGCLEYKINRISPLGSFVHFEADNITILLILLTSFIFLTSIYFSRDTIKKEHQLYYSLILMLESCIIGVFTSADMFMFFLFWEFELIPMFILILKWGSSNKQKTAVKFLLYTFLGSIFILLGFLLLYVLNYLQTGNLSTNFADIKLLEADVIYKKILFILFFIGFGIKLPVIPFHGWLADTHTNAVSPVSIILSSIMLKLGAYGIYRFNFILLNDVFIEFSKIIICLAIINIIYASCCAIGQKDIKRIIAYSGISNMGIFLLGLAGLNSIGEVGAIFQIISHSLISAGLFIVVGIIYIKCGTKNILRLRGLGVKMPKLMIISLIIVMAGTALPLTSGFISEFLCFFAAYSNENDFIKSAVILSLISVILSGIYLLKIFQGVFFGSLLEKYKKIKDVNYNSLSLLLVLTVYILFFGIFPSILINTIEKGGL